MMAILPFFARSKRSFFPHVSLCFHVLLVFPADYEAFMQRLLVGKVKGKLPTAEMERVEEVARKVEDALKVLV